MNERKRPVEDDEEWATLTEMLDFLRATGTAATSTLLREVTDGRTGQ